MSELVGSHISQESRGVARGDPMHWSFMAATLWRSWMLRLASCMMKGLQLDVCFDCRVLLNGTFVKAKAIAVEAWAGREPVNPLSGSKDSPGRVWSMSCSSLSYHSAVCIPQISSAWMATSAPASCMGSDTAWRERACGFLAKR